MQRDHVDSRERSAPTISSVAVHVPAVAPGFPQLRVVKGAERVAGRRVPTFQPVRRLVSVRQGERRMDSL